MKKLILAVGLAGLTGATAYADLLMYEPFDYSAGERLGGSGTNPIGKTNANGQVWITRSPAGSGTYTESRDTLITAGNLSYPGLAPSQGNSVRYGTNAATGAGLYKYTDAIPIPGAPYTTGTVYYSMIVRFHNTASIPGGARTSYAAFSEDTANLSDAGLSVITAGGTGNIPLPASAWIRNSGTTEFHFGAGKHNSDGLGPGTGGVPGSPAWQSSAVPHPYPNQHGLNPTGINQPWATISQNVYFMVFKYELGTNGIPNDDKVGYWVNPVSESLGDNAGEFVASGPTGAYYSATNSYTTPAVNLDAETYGIQSFFLIGNAQAATADNKSVDVTIDELRIGTTWADVTPSAPPAAPKLAIELSGANAVLSWPTNATGYALYGSPSLLTPDWQPVGGSVVVSGTNNTVTVGLTPSIRFFRLKN